MSIFARPRKSFNRVARDHQSRRPPRGAMATRLAPPGRGCALTTTNATAADVTIRAIRSYRRARADYERRASLEAIGDWSNLLADMFVEAERSLVAALLTWPAEGDPFFTCSSDRIRTGMRPRGVAFEGRIYLAVPEDAEIAPGREDPRGGDVMRLAIVEVPNIIELDARGGVR